jgi:predicted RNase H-like nuclease
VIFVGVDAAWGNVNETGLVCLEPTGDVRDAGWAIGLQPVVDWIVEHAEPDTLVFIDAPLILASAGSPYSRHSRSKASPTTTGSTARRRAGE